MEAQENADRIHTIWASNGLSPDTEFDMAYNETEGVIKDLIETFQQLPEYAANPVSVTELQEILEGQRDYPIDALNAFLSHLASDSVFNQTSGPVVAKLAGKIRSHLYEGRRVLLVPHSQGNLMALGALRALTDAEKRYVSFLAVASPAAPSNEFISLLPCELSTLDKVIAFTPGRDCPTFPGTFSTADVLGHNLVDIYTASGSLSLARISSDLQSYDVTAAYPQDDPDICPPIPEPTGYWSGQYTITACNTTSSTTVFEPCNNAVHYRQFMSTGTISFREDSSETNNVRRDWPNPSCDNATASIPQLAIGTTIDFPIRGNIQAQQQSNPRDTSITFTIDSVTESVVSGTFSAPFDYSSRDENGQLILRSGTAQGAWSAAPLGEPFPKCEFPVGTWFCSSIGLAYEPSGGHTVPCDWLYLSEPARPGEWLP